MNRLFYLDNITSKFITLCAFLFDTVGYENSEYKGKRIKASDFGGKELKHLKRELNVEKLRSFKLTFKLKKKISSSEFLPTGLNLTLEKLICCSTFRNEIKTDTDWELELFFWVNIETRKAFNSTFKRADELLRQLYFLNLLNNELISKKLRTIIANAKSGTFENLSEELPKFEAKKLIFRIHDIQFMKSTKKIVHYRKLSDGEHQFLQIFGALLLLDLPGALILLDEPETHFNPEWRSKFVDLVDSSLDNSREQEILITTHSPFIVSDCCKENVFKFRRDNKGVIKKAINPDFDTLGASINLITMKVFDKTETISQNIQKSFIEIIRKVKTGRLSKEEAIDNLNEFGDSIEKNIILGQLYKKK
jgi:restriction system-associated AAA family ATPase